MRKLIYRPRYISRLFHFRRSSTGATRIRAAMERRVARRRTSLCAPAPVAGVGRCVMCAKSRARWRPARNVRL